MKLFKTIAIVVILTLSIASFAACGEAISAKHMYCEWYVFTEATCTEKGEMRRECMNCNHYETKEIEATGHNIKHCDAFAPTHLLVGYDAYEYCTKCDYTTRVDIPEIAHEFVAEVVPPTCIQRGYTIYRCECGYEEVKEYVDELGHNYEVQTTPATCEQDGVTVYTCACGHTYEEVIPALGHKPSGWILVENPEDGSEGYMYKKCEHCGIILEKSSYSPDD